MLIFQVAIVANARRNAEEHSRRQVNTSQTNSESNPSVDRTFFFYLNILFVFFSNSQLFHCFCCFLTKSLLNNCFVSVYLDS